MHKVPWTMAMKKFFSHPTLVFGVAIRLLLIVVVAPVLHRTWFVPFLEHWTRDFDLDPWTSWRRSGGDAAAFPYGIGMLLLGLPAAVSARVLGTAAGSVVLVSALSIGDLYVGYQLTRMKIGRLTTITWVLSPIALYVTYVLGQTDVAVASLVFVAVIKIRTKRWTSAGAILGLATLFKLSALLLFPFFVVYAIRGKRERSDSLRFLSTMSAVLAVGMIPVLYSSGFREMVIGSRETGGLLDYSVSLGRSEPFLLVPVVYLAMLYLLWRQGRTTAGVTSAYAISALAIVVLVAPSSVGWYLWFLPAMLLLAANTGLSMLVSLNAMQMLAVAIALFEAEPLVTRFSSIGAVEFPTASGHVVALLQTLTLVTGLLAVASFLRRSVPQEDPLRIGQKPFSIGIAGDSGTGKDTLSNALVSLFPRGTCQVIEGDDYHLYERGAVEWSTLTHLNPQANNLSALREDVLKARRRETIVSRRYDHSTGHFQKGRRIDAGDLVVVNGLHALYVDRDRDVYDVGVFLKMEDSLREKLKVERDSATRGVTETEVRASIQRRKPDSQRFIEPQLEEADLAIFLDLEKSPSQHERRLVCTISTKKLIFPTRLSAALNSLVVVKHEIRQGDRVGDLVLEVDANDLNSSDLISLLRYLEPEIHAMLMSEPRFMPGTLGFESLVILLATAERRRSGE